MSKSICLGIAAALISYFLGLFFYIAFLTKVPVTGYRGHLGWLDYLPYLLGSYLTIAAPFLGFFIGANYLYRKNIKKGYLVYCRKFNKESSIRRIGSLIAKASQNRFFSVTLQDSKFKRAPQFFKCTIILVFFIKPAETAMNTLLSLEHLMSPIIFSIWFWGSISFMLLSLIYFIYSLIQGGRFNVRNESQIGYLYEYTGYTMLKNSIRDLSIIKTKDEYWKEVIRNLFKHAELVIFDVSDFTEHIKWEIDICLNTLDKNRIIFICRKDSQKMEDVVEALNTLNNLTNDDLNSRLFFYENIRKSRKSMECFIRNHVEKTYKNYRLPLREFLLS